LAKNLEAGNWAVYERAKLSAVYELSQTGNIQVVITVGPGEEMDIVIVKDE
jgi:hypothetical protein